MVRDFYDKEGIKDRKTIVFSDSLNIQHCLDYKLIAEEAGFNPVFGVGTFLTSKFQNPALSFRQNRHCNSNHCIFPFIDDFSNKSDGRKSKPLNIVIKISSANGHPAVKLSDNMGKNTGDKATVQDVKKMLGYIEHQWQEGDESARWK